MQLAKPYLKLLAATITIFLGLCYLVFTIAHAFPVPTLPANNLLLNPWFRSAGDPTEAGLDGWTNVLQNGVGWGVSQKESNPSPDIVVSARCGFNPVYCGTAARWAEINDEGNEIFYPELDVYLYQVVSTDGSHHQLTFFAHWVSHRVEVLEVTIYGGGSPNGPWTNVWVPFFHTQDENPPPPPGGQEELWTDTDFLQTTITQGYSYYKVEIHARYPKPETGGGSVGAKITGVYFATESDTGITTPTPTQKPHTNKTPMPTKTPTWTPAHQIYLPAITKN